MAKELKDLAGMTDIEYLNYKLKRAEETIPQKKRAEAFAEFKKCVHEEGWSRSDASMWVIDTYRK